MSKGTKLLKEGDIISYKYGKFVVLEYQGCRKVRIQFLDEFKHERFVTAGEASRGSVSNPYARTNCDLGYIGIGAYTAKENKAEYSLWRSMFTRCYREIKTRNTRSYSNKYVHPQWYCFQDFAAWCQTQIGFKVKGWQLDKDILLKGNLEYSAEFCVFVPQRVNLLFVKADATRGKYPLGVVKSGKWFHVNCADKDNGTHYVGIFSNERDAFFAYKTKKEEIIKRVAEMYRDVVDPRVYKALINYEVNYSD